MPRKKIRPIMLSRDTPDRLVPQDFLEVIFQRYLPVLSLTYIASILGIAIRKDGPRGTLYYLLNNDTAYDLALLVALWVSIPAVLWILLKGTIRFPPYADIWYLGTAGMMSVIGIVFYLLFPEGSFWGLRVFFVASVPIFLVQYLFFVKGGFPPMAAWPATITGAVFFVTGIIV